MDLVGRADIVGRRWVEVRAAWRVVEQLCGTHDDLQPR